MVAHAFNPSILKTEAGESLEFQDRLEYTEKPCPENENKQKNKTQVYSSFKTRLYK